MIKFENRRKLVKGLLLLSLFITNLTSATAQDQQQQMWWGYSSADENRSSLGTTVAETYDMAIFVPKGHPLVSNTTIKAVRIYLRDTNCLTSLKVWVSRKLPKGTSIPEYIQDVDISTLTGGDESTYSFGLPNEIELSTPFAVGSDSVYVGYSFTVTDASTEAGKYPILTTNGVSEDALYIRSSLSLTSWMKRIGNKLAMQLLIEGNLRSNYVIAENFVEQAVVVGQTVNVPVTIENGGMTPVESIAYTVTTGEETTEEQTIEVKPALAYGEKAVIMIPITGDAQTGITERTITITAVNGQPNEVTAQAQGTLRTVDEIKTFERTVLVETFGTESTPEWPKATKGLYNMLTMYPELQKRVAIVSHHSGYYDDFLTTETDKEYEWLFGPESYIYVPAFTWDRYVSPTVSTSTPMTISPSTVNGHKRKIDERLAQPSSADLQLKATLNANKTELTVEATCERTRNFATTPSRLTLMLTEDNIEAQKQVGLEEGEEYLHRNVFRAANATWGEPLEWNEDVATYTYTFTLDPAWNTDNLQIVGFVSGYDENNAANCAVEQAAVCRLAGQNMGITVTEGRLSDGDNMRVYDLMGRTLSRSSLNKGVYIVGGKKFVKN